MPGRSLSIGTSGLVGGFPAWAVRLVGSLLGSLAGNYQGEEKDGFVQLCFIQRAHFSTRSLAVSPTPSRLWGCWIPCLFSTHLSNVVSVFIALEAGEDLIFQHISNYMCLHYEYVTWSFHTETQTASTKLKVPWPQLMPSSRGASVYPLGTRAADLSSCL